jgi:hypothetical protein
MTAILYDTRCLRDIEVKKQYAGNVSYACVAGRGITFDEGMATERLIVSEPSSSMCTHSP